MSVRKKFIKGGGGLGEAEEILKNQTKWRFFLYENIMENGAFALTFKSIQNLPEIFLEYFSMLSKTEK